MPIATVGVPFSIRATVSGEQVALSATCAILRLRLSRASLICSPTVCIFCSNFRGSLVPIVVLLIILQSLFTTAKIQLFLYFMID